MSKKLRASKYICVLSILVCTCVLESNTRLLASYSGNAQCQSDTGVHSLILSPNNDYVAAIWNGTTVKLWDRRSGQLLHTFSEDFDKYLSNVIFSPDSKRLLIGATNYAFLWDIQTGAKLQTFPPESDSAQNNLEIDVAFTPDGKYVFTGSSDGATKWNAETGAKVNVFPGRLATGSGQHIQLSSNGRYLLTHTDRWELWDAKTARRLYAFPRTTLDVKNHWFTDESASFSPDSKLVLINDSTGLSMWRTDTFQRAAILDTQKALRYWNFSPDSNYVAVFASDNGPLEETELWDISTGQKLHTFYAGNNAVEPMIFSPDSNHFWVASEVQPKEGGANQITVWDIAAAKVLTTFSIDQLSVEGDSFFTQDGKYWLSTDALGTSQLRESFTGKRITTYC